MGSEKLVVDLQPNVAILISSIGGDLSIEGSLDASMKVRGDNPRLNVENDGSSVALSCNGDCHLQIPGSAQLTIKSIGGDGKIIGIEGPIALENVGGDLTIRNSGALNLSRIGGDLNMKRIDGAALVGSVGGDAKIRKVNGDVTIEKVGGDAEMRDVHGGCIISSIGGDLVLSTIFEASSRYEFTVGSDVLGHVPVDSNVKFIVPADVETFIEIPGVRPQTDGEQDVYMMGDGAATVEFKSIGGELKLVDAGIGESMDSLFETSIPDDVEEVINARISEQIEAIQDRLHRETDRIRKQAERTAERVKQQAAAHNRAWGFGWSGAEKDKNKRGFGFNFESGAGEKEKRTTPSEPVSDQERLAILKMVEDKKITVEEAARLLSALEGTD